MKNEKFCFSKGAGLISIIGIVLVAAALLMSSLSGQATSTNTRASERPFIKGGVPTSAPTITPVIVEGLRNKWCEVFPAEQLEKTTSNLVWGCAGGIWKLRAAPSANCHKAVDINRSNGATTVENVMGYYYFTPTTGKPVRRFIVINLTDTRAPTKKSLPNGAEFIECNDMVSSQREAEFKAYEWKYSHKGETVLFPGGTEVLLIR